jgi:hypothetical protein
MAYINKYIKTQILKSQNYKCCGVSNYICPLATKTGGYFDESGYEIDHIIESSISKNNGATNLQALCPNCHSYKTKQFMKIYINKTYLKQYTAKDTSSYLHQAYIHCKAIIQQQVYFHEDITLSTTPNPFCKNYHIIQFPKNIDTILLLKYLSQSTGLNMIYLSGNNIFLTIKHIKY